ncbi:hypothetical protein ACFLXA_01210 [Chloroflexota bacterium]
MSDDIIDVDFDFNFTLVKKAYKLGTRIGEAASNAVNSSNEKSIQAIFDSMPQKPSNRRKDGRFFKYEEF